LLGSGIGPGLLPNGFILSHPGVLFGFAFGGFGLRNSFLSFRFNPPLFLPSGALRSLSSGLQARYVTVKQLEHAPVFVLDRRADIGRLHTDGFGNGGKW
jgi:hypothetical protein